MLEQLGYKARELDTLTLEHADKVYVAGEPRDKSATMGTYFPISIFDEQTSIRIIELHCTKNKTDNHGAKQRKTHILDGNCSYVEGFKVWGVFTSMKGNKIAEIGRQKGEWVNLEELVKNGLNEQRAEDYKERLPCVVVRNCDESYNGIYVERKLLEPEHQGLIR